MVCSDGREAAFLSGGEIPIPIAQTSATGGATITVEWREFGVRLRCVPTIIDSNLINLKIEPEVSNLDFGNAVVVGGFVVPALRTRRASTEVELHSDESLIIGGLRSSNVRELKRMIPVLGHIPILGHLFRSTTKAEEESELVIIVSPQIIRPEVASDEPLLHDSAMPQWREGG
jgi:pilus assembly protein CpaC